MNFINIYKSLIIYTILTFNSGCGGGSNTNKSNGIIEGKWSGDIFQGVITCSDGISVGAGGAIPTKLEFQIEGSDDIGSLVHVQENLCLLEGERNSSGFIVKPIKGCAETLKNIEFRITNNNSLGVKYSYDLSKQPVNDFGARCYTSPDGEIFRD